jgi:hypothetical protein
MSGEGRQCLCCGSRWRGYPLILLYRPLNCPSSSPLLLGTKIKIFVPGPRLITRFIKLSLINSSAVRSMARRVMQDLSCPLTWRSELEISPISIQAEIMKRMVVDLLLTPPTNQGIFRLLQNINLNPSRSSCHRPALIIYDPRCDRRIIPRGDLCRHL